MENSLTTLLVIAGLLVGALFGAVFLSDTEVIEPDCPEVDCPEVDCPEVKCPNVSMPEFEDANNKMLNEFLEDTYQDKYDEIENESIPYATEELEDNDYQVIVDYMKDSVDGVDEDSIDVSVKDTEVEVIGIGLGEDEDKSAEVVFEIKVEYELEEGVVEEYRKYFDVTYEVLFEEGDFDDEEVELVSILE
ncbi:MAG: hypothetical protein ACOC1O_05880 [bacterium]